MGEEREGWGAASGRVECGGKAEIGGGGGLEI